jgi:hypothetical protein
VLKVLKAAEESVISSSLFILLLGKVLELGVG